MSEDRQQATKLTVECSLEVDPALKHILDPAHPFHAAISQALVDGLSDLMTTLGIPGQPSIQLHVLEEAVPHFMNVQVNGQACPYQAYIYRRIYAYVRASITDLQDEFEVIWAWLHRLAQELSTSTEDEAFDKHPLIEFLTSAFLEIVKMQPAVLLSLEQAEEIKQLLPQPTPFPEEQVEGAEKDAQAKWLHGVLTKILQQNISLADTQTIGLTLSSMRESSPEELAEELIAKLSADTLEIHLPQDLLRTVTTTYDHYFHGHLRNIRQTMMQTFGLSLPEMRFVLNENLKARSFTCKINNLLMLPWVIVEENALDYMEQLLLLNMRENRRCFVHRRAVEQLLVPYKQSSPLLFRLSSSQLSIYRLSMALRILIIEEVSIRNLAFIVERLLNYKHIVADPSLPLTFEELFPVIFQEDQPQPDHPTYWASFVRIGLKREISYNYAGKQRQLYNYVFQNEPLVELALSISHDYHSQEQLNPPDTQPVMITSIGVRSAVQEFINRGLLPSIPVLAYQELISGLHVQLVERIVTDTPAKSVDPSESQENTKSGLSNSNKQSTDQSNGK